MSSREDFEAWCKSDNPRYDATDDSWFNRRDWQVWQAALSQPAAPAPKDAESAAEIIAERDAFMKECDLLKHMVITCGVAATHPDASLTLKGAYAGKWNSQQAERVRKLRAERDDLDRRCSEYMDAGNRQALRIAALEADSAHHEKVIEDRSREAHQWWSALTVATKRIAELKAQLAAQPVAAQLTNEQIYAIAGPADYFDRNVFARAIEAAHGIGITAAAHGEVAS